MKIISYLITTTWLLAALLLSSCDEDSRTYAKQLKAERLLIDEYIKRNRLKIVDKMPSKEAFLNDEKLYYKSPSGLYYRLEQEGRNDLDTIAAGDKLTVGIKYMEYTLAQPADTVDYWSPEVYPYWREFAYGSSATSPAIGIIEAVSYMRRSEAEAKLILTTKLGFDPYGDVIPHAYLMKIRFTKNSIPK